MAGWHKRLQTLIRQVESRVGFSPTALFETSSSCSGRLPSFSSQFHCDAASSQKLWVPPPSRPFYCYLQQLGISSSSKLLADEPTPVSSPLMPMLPSGSGGEKSETQKAVTKPAKVQAVLKGIKQSPKKVNLVAELVRGMRVEDALLQLQVTIKRASQTVYQVIHSARANATHNHGLDADRLIVAEAFVGKGFFKKRISYHGKGKCGLKVRPECRLTVVVRETTPEEEAQIAKLKVHNFKKLSKRERRLVPHTLIETTPIWNRKAKSNRGTSNATSA